MIKIKNKIFPLPGFTAITIWPFIFHKEEMSNITLNHEMIHAIQQRELLLIGFYLIYIIEWIFHGYRNISFEKEAYENESNLNYLNTRKAFGFIKY